MIETNGISMKISCCCVKVRVINEKRGGFSVDLLEEKTIKEGKSVSNMKKNK